MWPYGREGSSPSSPTTTRKMSSSKTRVDKKTLSYVIGVAIGDGNLSNPNGRATRLRVSCDTKYPELISRISSSIKKILPNNKVSIIKRAKTYIDISCYSNRWEGWLGWKASFGPKYKQGVRIPGWIKRERELTIRCLRGLFETDGSYYQDRGYNMAGFVTIIPSLAKDVEKSIKKIGFKSHTYLIKTGSKSRYNMRVSRDAEKFVKLIKYNKS